MHAACSVFLTMHMVSEYNGRHTFGTVRVRIVVFVMFPTDLIWCFCVFRAIMLQMHAHANAFNCALLRVCAFADFHGVRVCAHITRNHPHQAVHTAYPPPTPRYPAAHIVACSRCVSVRNCSSRFDFRSRAAGPRTMPTECEWSSKTRTNTTPRIRTTNRS